MTCLRKTGSSNYFTADPIEADKYVHPPSMFLQLLFQALFSYSLG